MTDPKPGYPSLSRQQKAASKPTGGFSSLKLEDFSLDLAKARSVSFSAADLDRARAEGHAEGAAEAYQQQIEHLASALSEHAKSLSSENLQRKSEMAHLRGEFSTLLRALAEALLPVGRAGRLTDAMTGILSDLPPAQQANAVIHCPDDLIEPLSKACALAGLPMPTTQSATDIEIRLDHETMRIDLRAMQTRLMQLIDEYSAGEK